MNESGSGSVLGLGIIFALVGVLCLGVRVQVENLALARLQASADTAVLAAADALRGLSVGFPCETADGLLKSLVQHWRNAIKSVLTSI